MGPQTSGVIPVGARRHGQEGELAPLWKCCKVFLCITSYSKTLSKRTVYDLFSQPIVRFCGLCPDPYRGGGSIPLGDFRSQIPSLPHPWKKILQAPIVMPPPLCLVKRQWLTGIPRLCLTVPLCSFQMTVC